MKREKAVALFQAGAVLGARIVPAPMDSAGCMLEIETRHGGSQALETTRAGKVRMFKTLDAAANEARTIGFGQVALYL